MDRCPDLLAHALRLIGENTWKDASGIRTIDEAIEFEALREQAALLVKALEERCAGSDGERKEAYGGLLTKARGLLLEQKGQALQTTNLATQLGKIIASQDGFRQN